MFPIIIAGPTASGKTAVSRALAQRLNGEIISADSRQVYKYLDIGTNKEGAWDPGKGCRVTGGTCQHLTDIIEPSETFSAGEFARRAREIIALLSERGRTSIITGGTGLYIKAFVDGLSPLPASDPAVRSALISELKTHGLEYLYNQLAAVDPEAAQKNKSNPQRITRALEVYRLTGIPISQWHRNVAPRRENCRQFGILWPRGELNEIIAERSKTMFASGMIEETKNALARGYAKDSPGLQGIGYRSIIRFLDGTATREEAQTGLSLDTRHYAKRQMTWFKKDTRIRWIETAKPQFDPDIIADKIVKELGI
ncbi:MAG: tRNA (adenosine(37)-N6)-dimethylallyltransferase MiaA [Elusimicrobia bacterium RIFOXYB2_FULL_50_12]|nr:MAG: tRNA (adenosine(37)-N6)-dimethylallyltransferase MiaA [Elusimicrobia bacterium RIFOXYB2_FULL_50_12]